MSDDVDVELIAFKNPVSAQVFLPRIKWRGAREQLVHLVEHKFSKYGLVHHVYAAKSKGIAGQPGKDASSFYSIND